MRRAALLLLAGALLAGCGDETRLTALSPGDVVLAFGNSITYGTGADRGESYPEVLAEITGLDVRSRGVPGEVSARGLARLSGVLDAIEPKLVVLCHAGNDILKRRSKARAADNLRAMITKIRDHGAEVVMLGVPNFGLFLDAAPFYLEVAEELEVPIDAEILPAILSDNDLKADPVHPNAEGYRALARAVKRLLEDHGAL